MKKLNGFNTKGFTLIELLMVILIIAILALMAITQFANYTKDARDASLKSNLQLMRRGIQQQYGQMRLRCGIRTTAWPGASCVNANNITSGVGTWGCTSTDGCAATYITEVANQVFVNSGIPQNPWSKSEVSTEMNFVTTSASTADALCDTNLESGWCYNTATGEIWPNSQENNGAGSGTENAY
jgi:prepilin-type N-terminal cleavage/methylation domain-containing protein